MAFGFPTGANTLNLFVHAFILVVTKVPETFTLHVFYPLTGIFSGALSCQNTLPNETHSNQKIVSLFKERESQKFHSKRKKIHRGKRKSRAESKRCPEILAALVQILSQFPPAEIDTSVDGLG